MIMSFLLVSSVQIPEISLFFFLNMSLILYLAVGADQTRLRLTHETSFVKLHTSFWTAIPFFFYVVKKLLFLSLPIASNVFLML